MPLYVKIKQGFSKYLNERTGLAKEFMWHKLSIKSGNLPEIFSKNMFNDV